MRSVTLALALATTAAAACTNCGQCYNVDGQHTLTCVDTPEDCPRYYAPYGCPAGVDCQATNSPEARNCLDAFDDCCGPPSDVDATWTAQQAELSSHDWVVLDHAPGTSFGLGVTATATHVFTAGSMAYSITLTNAATGASVVGSAEGEDRDIFLAKISVDGTPAAVYTYRGDTGKAVSYPRDLHASPDGQHISMGGYFTGTLTMGDTTLVNARSESDGDLKDGFVAKIRAEDGTAVWAWQRTATEATSILGTQFSAANGDVAYSGSTKAVGGLTVGVVGVLDADGAPRWEKVWGDGARACNEVAFDGAGEVLVAALSLQGSADFGGAVGELASDLDENGAPVIEALVLGLAASTGEALWATRVSSDDGTSSGASLVEVVGGAAFVTCGGACALVYGPGAAEPVPKASRAHDGAVLKLDAATGALEWAADVPGPLGFAVNAKGEVFLQVMAQSLTFGDASFASMGGSSGDQYVVKLGDDGKGLWVLQQGGGGMEYLRRMAIDANGDVYTTGMTGSNPVFFDPLVVDTHMADDATSDLFVAKLRTSAEALPPCKTSADEVEENACFVANACYAAGEAGRGQLSCLACDAATSQDALTGPAPNACFIDGACAADGAPRTQAGRGPPLVSECQYCDASKAQDAWSVKPGFVVDKSKPLGQECAEEGASDDAQSTECGFCGNCYNRDGRHTVQCVKGYDAQCVAWYAPHDCPPGATCYATNDADARGCLDELDACYGPSTACGAGPLEQDTPSPTPAPPPGGSKKKKKSGSGDAEIIGLSVGLVALALVLAGVTCFCCSKNAELKKQRRARLEKEVENEMVLKQSA